LFELPGEPPPWPSIAGIALKDRCQRSSRLLAYLGFMERLDVLERYVHKLAVHGVFQRDAILVDVVDQAEIGFHPGDGVKANRFTFEFLKSFLHVLPSLSGKSLQILYQSNFEKSELLGGACRPRRASL
jgi:hypothetical protein